MSEGHPLPYVNIQLTGDKLAAEQKLEIIQRITKVFVDVLQKDPATTFIVIQEIDPENWGVHGTSVALRRAARARGEKV
ncbi:tautomerase family protein [Corallococcus sicarius]|uniref:tautomerase family protein n=1 Tax=Corallococcus sicarius TaxID=2316726 RepID=UPI00244687B6|nr:4-oxalocrotonate tautomerase family protein [Corallococcus sicarius]